MNFRATPVVLYVKIHLSVNLLFLQLMSVLGEIAAGKLVVLFLRFVVRS